MQALYAGFPAALHGQLLSLVEAMAACDTAALIHCTAGKDRTGFAVAILMAALGVPMPQIMADYLASLGRANAQAREETRQLTAARLGFQLADDTLDRLMTVHESYLAASFARSSRISVGWKRISAQRAFPRSISLRWKPFCWPKVNAPPDRA